MHNEAKSDLPWKKEGPVMNTNITEAGLTIPKEWFDNCEQAIVFREGKRIVVIPLRKDDPIWELGKNPVADTVTDASTNLDKYLTEQ